MGQAWESAKPQTPQLQTASVAPPEGWSELLRAVLEETEAAGQLMPAESRPTTVDVAVFTAAARRLKQEQASSEQAIAELVRLATPAGLAQLFCTPAAWEAILGTVVQRLASDAVARTRLLSLWERLAS